MTSEDVLVIILSSTLAIFLVLSIIVAIKSIQILNAIKRITDKVEEIADKAETVSNIIAKSAGFSVVGKLLSFMMDNVFNKKVKKSKYKK